MSDTPRTDASRGWAYTPWGGSLSDMIVVDPRGAFVDVAFAQKLERELNAANKRVFDLEKVMRLVGVRCEHLHHAPHHRHGALDECPVEAKVRTVLDGGGR